MKDDPNRILVVKEEHSDRYFRANTDRAIHKAALEILRRVVDQGWIIHPKHYFGDLKGYECAPATITELKEDLEKVTNDAIREAIEAQISIAEKMVEELEEVKALWDSTQKALKGRKGALAWEILQGQKGSRYGEFYFAELK